MARRGKTRAQDLVVAERRAYVFELRAARTSYALIAQTIRADPRWASRLPKWYDQRQVHKDVLRELEQRRPLLEHVEHVRQLELETLDVLQLTLTPRATGGDVAAIDRVLAIMARRAKYLPNLEVPLHLQIDPLDALAQLLGVPRDELPAPPQNGHRLPLLLESPAHGDEPAS
jgi:Holliday junction resolvasome RuvABC ATP-dependent DNA helicase subunit